MDLTVRSGRQNVIVAVVGAIVPRTAPTLRECLLRVLNTAPPYVVLDISQVDRLDPGVLPVIAEAQRGARLLGGWLCLVYPDGSPHELLEAGLLPTVPRYTTVEAALAAQLAIAQQGPAGQRAGVRSRYFGAGTARRGQARRTPVRRTPA